MLDEKQHVAQTLASHIKRVYSSMDPEQREGDDFASRLAQELVDRGFVSGTSGYADGIRATLSGVQMVRVPRWARLLRPRWFRDLEVISRDLSASVGSMPHFAKRPRS